MSDFRDVDSPLAWFRHWVDTKGNDLYLTQPMGGDEVLELSWQQVDDRARRMAAWITAQGFPAASQIAILSKNCHEWIIADLAIWMAGHVSVPLYPTLAAETVSQILEHSESKMIFVGKLDDWEMMKPGVPADMPGVAFTLAPDDALAKYPHFHSDIVEKTEPMALGDISERASEDLATLVYTSGSTGVPKGVMHSFGSLARAARGGREQIDVGDKERFLSYLPLAHVAERSVVENSSLFNGSEVYFADTLDTFLQDLRRARPTIFFSVPRLWTKFRSGVLEKMPEKKLNFLLKVPIISGKVKTKILTQLGLEHVRFGATGAAPLPPETIAWYRSLGLELLEVYGMSENFGYSHANAPGRAKVGTVGGSCPGVITKIADNGEILVKSPANMLGYYKMPEKTAEEFTEDGYFMTGDRGEVDSDGCLTITGRTKELFKTAKGKYVAPSPIENKLGTSAHIEVCCVSGADQGQPHALIMLSEEGVAHANANRDAITAEFEAHRKAINDKLSPHEQLQFLAIVKDSWDIDNGFLTPTMKIKRNVIEDAYLPHVDEWYAARQGVIWQA